MIDRDRLKSLFDKWQIGTDDDAEMAQEAVMEMVPDILAALPQTEVSEAVREALEPFAKIAEEINKDYHDSRQIYQYGDLRLYGADFRRARALTEKQKGVK
jgi:hypothetical protein